MGEGIERGKSFPLGATIQHGGVNFSVYSKSSLALQLVLFDGVGDAKPSRVISLEPRVNRSYHYWHVFVPGIRPGQLYGYRAFGPFDPAGGQRFDRDKVLLDPYGHSVAVPPGYDRKAASRPGDNTVVAMKSVVVDSRSYDWEDDAPLDTPFSETIIYEMHVGGFTRHPNSGVARAKRGTYVGLIEKIPYLKSLGITAVELLPVFQFDEQDAPPGLVNYWGYSPVSFFAPHVGYSSRKDPLGPLDEFRDMVKALHRAGIEVILDVVFNHTAEIDETGPTFCFRGLENGTYYILDKDRAKYANFSGTGNTLNTNHSIVRRMILDSLHFWVQTMHVDGFRFDLASILSRDESGHPQQNAPILWDIESDPVLAGTKLIAEAWDAGGLYQVGTFIGDSWQEWNGRFRDDVRGFMKGDSGTAARILSRLIASPDLYGHEEREPEQSINFVTCHDGFTMNDLVSYNAKHNDENRQNNQDGTDSNLSWNCGVEGPAPDAQVDTLRNRQCKNFLAVTLLALGTPMLLMGDEVRRTQRGNNNAFCQDNEVSWFDWALVEKHAGLLRFVKQLICYRLHPDTAVEHNLSLNEFLIQAQVQWHGAKLHQPDLSHDSHTLAYTAKTLAGRFLTHTILNAYWEPLEFELPPNSNWHRWIDTVLEPPDDICEWHDAPAVQKQSYLVQPRSVVVLFARM